MITDDKYKNKNSVKNEYKGLCLNCKYLLTCTFIKNSEKPVLQCEEYDCATPDSTKDSDKKTPVKSSKQITPDIDDKDSCLYKGLCVNCEVRKICKYPKPEGGIWHCEEYR